MFKHHIKIAFRNLRKYKSQTFIGVLGLTAACIVFAIACYTLFSVITVDRVYPEHKRMYTIKHDYQTVMGDMRQTLGEFSHIEKTTAISWSRQYYTQWHRGENEIDRFVHLSFLEASPSILDFFSLKIILGNERTILNTPNSIVLYESKAQKLGAIDALHGSTLSIDNVFYTVTGIIQDVHENSKIFHRSDGIIFNQHDGYLQKNHETWNFHGAPRLMVMLQEGMSQKDFQKTLDNYPFVLVGQKDPNFDARIYIASINEIEKGTAIVLTFVLFIGGLILFVALFNIISFQISQIYNRLKECAIRKVNGSSKWQLLLSFYAEIFVIFFLSLLLGLPILNLLMSILEQQPQIVDLFEANTLALMRKHLLFSVTFGLLVTFLFCLIPVQMISRQSVRVVFMGLSEKVSKQRGRRIMLFFQMFVLLLFMSTALIVKLQVEKVTENIWHCLSHEERDHIFCFHHTTRSFAPPEIIMQKLAHSAVVEQVFLSSRFAMRGLTYGGVTVDIHEEVRVKEHRVGSNFSEFFNVKIVNGRFWTENDPPNVTVVDETFAALFPDGNPVGAIFWGRTILGVVEYVQMTKETHVGHPQDDKLPVFYIPVETNTDYGNEIFVKAINGKQKEAQEVISQIQQEFYPDFARTHYDFQTTFLKYLFDGENFFSQLFGIFSTICLILCLLSIYSAITMNTEKRRKEVAIRKINGAEIKDIVVLFGKSYFLLWSGVCLLLFPVIYYVGNMWLETYNQRISLNIFFFSGLYFSILLLIIFMIIFRILDVARCNPAEVVKTD